MKIFFQIRAWIDSNNLVLILIALYFLISIIKIEHPGVNNDQLMFVNSATPNPDNMFLWKSFHAVPIMIFPYIGALKSYLYMPIFHFFGVNIFSIRLPHILIISASLYLLYKTLTLQFNKKIALLTILLLAFDPSQIAYSRIDTGPTVIEFFFKVLTIYLFYLYLSTKNVMIFLSIYPVLALGIFNKINFFWFVNAFFVSFVIFYGRSFYNAFKVYGRFVPLVLYFIPYYLLLRFFIKLSRETYLSYKNFANEVSLGNIFTNFPIFYKNLAEIINGNLLFNITFGYSPTNFGRYFSSSVMLVLLATFLYVIIKSKYLKNPFLKPYLFTSFMTILMVVQVLLTKKAILAWHTLSIYPFFTILLASGIFQLYILIKSQNVKNLIILLVVFMVFYQTVVDYLYIHKYSSPTKSIALSSTIYDLIDYAKENKVKFICLDVDICNQLLSFNQEVGKYKEPFSFLDPQTYNDSFAKIVGNFNRPDEFLYVSHDDKMSHFPNLKQSFFKFLKDNGVDYIKIKDFKDGENISFEVYKVGYKLKF